MNQQPVQQHQWRTLLLVVFTNMTVVAIPMMGISVLSKQISSDLGLTVVQVGVVWGIAALPGIVFSLVGGAIGDRIGPRRILAFATLIAGLLGASRGLAPSFGWLTVTVILLGAVQPFVIMNGLKTIGEVFPSHQLGLANGLSSVGFALGFLLGSMLSATVLSPLLGGWRYVLIGYGLLGVLMSIPWMVSLGSEQPRGSESNRNRLSYSISRVIRNRDIWLLGLALFGFSGCIQGLLGYLPLYLRGLGWAAVQADGTVGAFHGISMLFVMPVALLSDRLKSRKVLLLMAAASAATGVALLSVARGGTVWVAVMMAGLARDAFMAMILAMAIEAKGIGPSFAGTATGLVMAISGIANVAAPPLGNSLAGRFSGAPFLLWSGFALFGVLCLSFVGRGRAQPAS